MQHEITRRGFMARSLTGAAAMGLVGTGAAAAQDQEKTPVAGKLRKACQYGMIQGGKSPLEKLKIAQECGWDGVETGASTDQTFIGALREASDKTGMPVHSVVCETHWSCPLSDPDPAKVQRGMDGMRAALKNARDLKADAVLLVPAVVTDVVRYKDAYERSQKCIRELIPTAEECKVVIAVENVWNKFLLSPLEFAQYIDEFNSKFVRAYFDVGNVVIFGYPQDWILTLGARLAKIHLKDFKRAGSQWVQIRDGDVQWPAVRKALAAAGYTGWLTTEVGGGNEAYLKNLAGRVDKIIAGS
jgi:L-ribulose-5-phosphate 3-epimerase